MILLLDIGNTNTHLGLADGERVIKAANFPTTAWWNGSAPNRLKKYVGNTSLQGAALCSVVPRGTPLARKTIKRFWNIQCLELKYDTLRGIGIDYPHPEMIGPDRLANALAARGKFGAPAVVVDLGTAVTLDVVNRAGNFAGGIIAPGLAVMTEYLHEKTALLPRIEIRDVSRSIGKSTREAMLIGAVHGYRGLIRALLLELKKTLRARRLPVVATGGYAELLAVKLPEITVVVPLLTLEGLRLFWQSCSR